MTFLYNNTLEQVIEQNQVWSLKSETSEEKLYVCIASELILMDTLQVVRVRPISFETEYAAQDDEHISAGQVFDRPFIVEYWNERPIPISYLNKMLGSVNESTSYEGEPFLLTNEQKAFRRFEIDKYASFSEEVMQSIIDADEPGNVFNLENSRKYMSLAASILLVCVSVFVLWQPTKKSDEELFQNHGYVIYNDFNFSDDLNNNSNKCPYEGLSIEECLLADKSLDLYQNNDYEQARVALSQLLKPYTRNSELLFVLSLTELYTENTESAIQHLAYLNEVDQFRFKEEVEYYLGMAYLIHGEHLKSRRCLRNIDENSHYSKDAKQVLKDMRWF